MLKEKGKFIVGSKLFGLEITNVTEKNVTIRHKKKSLVLKKQSDVVANFFGGYEHTTYTQHSEFVLLTQKQVAFLELEKDIVSMLSVYLLDVHSRYKQTELFFSLTALTINNQKMEDKKMDKNLILISEKNQEKIMDIFKEKQGKARERLVKDFSQLLDLIDELNRNFFFASQSGLDGVRVKFDFGQHFPNCYGGSPQSTHFELEYKKGKGWYLDKSSIKRDFCPNRDECYRIKLTEKVKEEIVKDFMKKIGSKEIK